MRRTAAARDGRLPARAPAARDAQTTPAQSGTRRPRVGRTPPHRHAATRRRQRRPVAAAGSRHAPSALAARHRQRSDSRRPSTRTDQRRGRHRGGDTHAAPAAAGGRQRIRPPPCASRRVAGGRARVAAHPNPFPAAPAGGRWRRTGGLGGTANTAASGRGALRGDLMAPTPPRSMSPARWSRGARRQPDVSVCLLVRAEQVEWGLRVATRGQGAFSVPTRTHKTNLRTKPTQPTLPCGHATLVTRSPPSQSTCLPHHPATRHTNRLDKHAPVHTNPCQQHPTLNKEKKNLARPTTRHHPHTRATPQRLTTTPLCLVSSLAPNTHTRGPPPLKAPTTQQDAHPRGSLHHPAGRAASGPASTSRRSRPSSPPPPLADQRRLSASPQGQSQRPAAANASSHSRGRAIGKHRRPTNASRRPAPTPAARASPPPSPVAACRRSWQRTASPRHHHQLPAANASGDDHAPATATSHPPSTPV